MARLVRRNPPFALCERARIVGEFGTHDAFVASRRAQGYLLEPSPQHTGFGFTPIPSSVSVYSS